MIGALAVGRAEAGPRALGNRSIIADCRNVATKERINGLIKQRFAFQPLAPICLQNDFKRYFYKLGSNIDMDFMQFALSCKPIAFQHIPAAIHANGTARIQLVRVEKYPQLYNILIEYKKITGIGVLINTSFNEKNKPIVNTPSEAYMAYKCMGLDFLALDDYVISRHLI